MVFKRIEEAFFSKVIQDPIHDPRCTAASGQMVQILVSERAEALDCFQSIRMVESFPANEGLVL
jgi:hypothetical protein